MKGLLCAAFSVLLLASHACAQETAKVQITIKISDKTPSFKDRRLVIMMYHNHPTQDDRGNTAVDKHIDAKFSHEKGKETVLTCTLGENAMLKRNVQYSVNASVFDGNRCTHTGEINGQSGPFNVLSNGYSNKVTLIVRPVP